MQAKGGKKYSWALGPHGMLCFVDVESFQTVTKFWEVTEVSAFHDAELREATKQINGIFKKLEKGNKDPSRVLSFVRFQNRHFLVWARYGVVSQFDQEKAIINALKLKMK
jgi:hypothetical protein